MSIHSTAIVHPKARVDSTVEMGPYCVIHENVEIKSNVKLDSHVVVNGWTTINEGCRIHSFASIGGDSQDLKFAGERTFVKIGPRTILREYVTVNGGTGEDTETLVGADCLIMAYSHIAHNCIVGNGVIIANCGTLAGHVTVDDQAVIGGLGAVHQFCHIGTLAIVGGCSKVVQDIPPYMMADGHPAAIRGLNVLGIKRNEISDASQKELKNAFKAIYRSGLNTSNAIAQLKSLSNQHSAEFKHFIQFIESTQRGISKG